MKYLKKYRMMVDRVIAATMVVDEQIWKSGCIYPVLHNKPDFKILKPLSRFYYCIHYKLDVVP